MTAEAALEKAIDKESFAKLMKQKTPDFQVEDEVI